MFVLTEEDNAMLNEIVEKSQFVELTDESIRAKDCGSTCYGRCGESCQAACRSTFL